MSPRPRLHPLLVLLLLLAGTAAPLSAMSLAGRQNRREFMDAVRATFLREDFATLEATAADLRARKDRFPDGVWTLPAFYDALEVENFTRRDFETRLPKWKVAQPNSVAVRIVEALAIQSDRYLHPEVDPATEMPHPLSARALLDEAEKLSPNPPADWYSAMIRLALQQGWGRAPFDALYQRAIAAEPGYFSYYFNCAAYLRTYGASGEWEAYALDTARQNTSGEGLGIYSRIAWSLSEGFADDYLAKWTAIRWPVMRDGFREMEGHWPNSDWNLNNFCRYACLAGDRDTARALFTRIGDRWTTNWLSHKSFLEWQTWANAREIPAPVPTWRFVPPDEDHPLAWTIQFAPDGGSLFAGYDHARIVRWDLRTGQAAWRGDLAREGSVDGLAVSPDGRWLAAGTGSRNRAANVPGAVGLWDLRAPNLPTAPTRRMEDGKSGVHNLRFSPDGRLLVSAGYNQIVDPGGELRVWTVGDWQQTRHDFLRLDTVGVAWLGAAGERLAFAASKSFDVVDTATGAHVFWPDHDLHATFVNALASSPDGQSLACVTSDGYSDRDRPGELTVWNTADWTRRDAPHVTAAGGLRAVAFSPDGKQLAGGGYDGILRLWDAGTGQPLATWPPETNAGKINAAAFSPDGGQLAVVHDDGVILVYPCKAAPR